MAQRLKEDQRRGFSESWIPARHRLRVGQRLLKLVLCGLDADAFMVCLLWVPGTHHLLSQVLYMPQRAPALVSVATVPPHLQRGVARLFLEEFHTHGRCILALGALSDWSRFLQHVCIMSS